MKVKILKDHEGRKSGEVLDIEWKDGGEKEYIDNGFIEVVDDKEKVNHHISTETVNNIEDAEYYKWVGIIERYPETFSGEINDLATVPTHLLTRLADKFDFIAKYLYRKREPNTPTKREIEIPGDDSVVSDFANGLCDVLADKEILFYRTGSRQVVEIGIVENEEESSTGFIPVKPSRFVSLIEDYFLPWTWRYSKSGQKFKVMKSMNKDVAGTVLDSHIIENRLPKIKRIFTVQTPIIKDGELTFPKEGYDNRFFSYVEKNSPTIDNMEMGLEEAKDVIYNLFKEFCFETKQDYINAVSALLTPFLGGLYEGGFNTRTPIYFYEANRERSGKDYLAGITGILYEGAALEEPPISTGDKNSANEETRKRVVSSLILGRKRYHSSNNKGNINNAVLESVTTAKTFSDRILGKNDMVKLDNEMCFSLSGNIGVTLSPDLANRTIFVKLFLDLENANDRKFSTPNLHEIVLNNRNNILSALYSLVRNWFDKGCPDGSVPFASFPEWARVCGGIMEAAGYENPCVKQEQQSGISIDTETDEMKELFELCYSASPEKWIDKNEIKELLRNSDIMVNVDWENKGHQTRFGIKLNKFVGRILSDIRLIVKDKNIRTQRWKYKFSKNKENGEKNDIFGEKSGHLATFGNLLPSPRNPPIGESIKSTPNVPKVTNVTTTIFTDEEIKKAGYTKKDYEKLTKSETQN